MVRGVLLGHSWLYMENYRDTVSSIGIIKGKNLPGTDSPDHICFFRHALALDECRVKFMPEYARGGVMLDAGVSQQAARFSHSEGPLSGPRVKETWFKGTHSDMWVLVLRLQFALKSMWAEAAGMSRTPTWIVVVSRCSGCHTKRFLQVCWWSH